MSNYINLASDLHDISDSAIKYFKKHHGLKSVKIEQAVNDSISLRPTFSGKLSSGYVVWVVAASRAYLSTLDSVVVTAANKSIPAKIYVVTPPQKNKSRFNEDKKKCREAGIGVLQVDEGKVEIIHQPRPLTFFSVRKPDVGKFPTKYRERVTNALDLLDAGDPTGSCRILYEEIELISTKFCSASKDLGWIKFSKPADRKLFEKWLTNGPWSKLLEFTQSALDYKLLKSKCPSIDKRFLGRTHAYTEERNLLSHKPKTEAALKERDSKLRTWFEQAHDLHLQWCVATKSLRI